MLIVLLILSFVGIVYGIVSIVKQKVFKEISLPASKSILTFSTVIFLTSLILNLTLYKIGAREVGVVITPKGVSQQPLYTGWHIVAPWSTVKVLDKSIQVYSLTQASKEGSHGATDAIWAPTSDGIKMGFDISVNWRLDETQAAWIYSNLASNLQNDADVGSTSWIDENIIRPAVKSVLPLTISQYTPIECYSDKRTEIQAEVLDHLRKELKNNKIVVELAQIRDVFYNPQYEQAINQKKLEEQKVMTLQQITKQKEEQLKQSQIDKDIAIQKAEGEAQALKIKGEAINQNPKIVSLEWITKWNGKLPTYMLGNSQGIMLNLQQ